MMEHDPFVGTKRAGNYYTLSNLIYKDYFKRLELRSFMASTLERDRDSRVVKVSDRGWLYHELEPSTTKDLSCMAAMHVKPVES
ncbi:hypothetical protein TNCV_664391 [Trichonephila clavipes]|nr:hypothetical protein TNCV_664391 [Trichonephila clavipes]